jgi:DIE2/ALG10 family
MGASGVVAKALQRPSLRVCVFAAVGLSFIAALLFFDFLRFPLEADERHFWPTTLWLFSHGYPTLEQLRSYPELNTPLPFLLFGLVQHVTGTGVIVARYINFASALGFIALIAAVGKTSTRAGLCAIGLLLCPYFFAVATHYYTDMITLMFIGIGLAAFINRRCGWSCMCFVLAIACRQYAVAFPIAILVYDLGKRIAAADLRLNSCSVWMSVAVISLGSWVLFFGGFGPHGAITNSNVATIGLYPAHTLYSMSCIGAYFVVAEALLFRSVSQISRPALSQLLIGIAITVLFFAFPPLGNVRGDFVTMGYLDKAGRLVLDDHWRLVFFYALAMLTCLRFAPFSLAGLIVYANAGLMMVVPVAWDKYALPVLACLWLLKSANRLDESGPQSVKQEHAVPMAA